MNTKQNASNPHLHLHRSIGIRLRRSVENNRITIAKEHSAEVSKEHSAEVSRNFPEEYSAEVSIAELSMHYQPNLLRPLVSCHFSYSRRS